jgi:hypothetical protein
VRVIFNDPAHPAILGVTPASDGSLNLTWTTAAAKTYRVQYTEDLANATWATLRELSATSDTLSISDATSGSAQRYYRIELLNP